MAVVAPTTLEDLTGDLLITHLFFKQTLILDCRRLHNNSMKKESEDLQRSGNSQLSAVLNQSNSKSQKSLTLPPRCPRSDFSTSPPHLFRAGEVFLLPGSSHYNNTSSEELCSDVVAASVCSSSVHRPQWNFRLRKKNKHKEQQQQQQSETDGLTHSLDKLDLCCHAKGLICLSRRQGLLVTIHHGISTFGHS